MFAVSTVFILGAGASWHYGYPTGEALVKMIVEKGRLLEQYLEFSMGSSNEVKPLYLAGYAFDGIDSSKQWQSALLDCRELIEGLEQVNPLVIDYYLGWNTRLEKVGKLLIAWAILDCERRGLESGRNINRPREHGAMAESRDDWCRFIVHQLAIDCAESKDLLKNRVAFVAFNYDVSLETTLRQNLRHIKLFKEEDVERFLGGTRVNHVYGMVPVTAQEKLIDWTVLDQNPKGVDSRGLSKYRSEYKAFLDRISEASHGLRVIDPHSKEANETDLILAQTAIANATNVYILGYGFDKNNSDRLALNSALKYKVADNKRVYFTNYGDSNRVNRRASQVFFSNPSHFNRDHPNANTPPTYQRSTRNVYDAFELDFEIES